MKRSSQGRVFGALLNPFRQLCAPILPVQVLGDLGVGEEGPERGAWAAPVPRAGAVGYLTAARCAL